MDYNLLVGSLQIFIAAVQLNLDHFTKPKNRQNDNDLTRFYDLGHAIRTLEFALAETVSFVGQTKIRKPIPRLASLWADASNCIREIEDFADLANLTFEKNLYWRNPEFYRGLNQNSLHRISLDNVLVQLRYLRVRYDKLQKKING
ncbi:hypothetical protein [Sphingobacterium mizutaii]|uniref:hypothetical protein n=1 Tax=Sphingobacterium mizutaii TaxID=1010 RepID=UPI0016245906|nr:hypothetical protein [Sphingobacterium mizutaii]